MKAQTVMMAPTKVERNAEIVQTVMMAPTKKERNAEKVQTVMMAPTKEERNAETEVVTIGCPMLLYLQPTQMKVQMVMMIGCLLLQICQTLRRLLTIKT